MPEYSILGKRTPREESVPKVTGEANFTMDMTLPGMLYGKVLTSPHPHARILNIDTSRARSLHGVKAVIIAKDLPHRPLLRVVSFPTLTNVYVLALDRVRYVGEVIAAVAAVDEDTAEEALDLIDVEYEILPAVLNLEEAMQPDAIRIHDDAEGNIAAVSSFEHGDVEKGFRECDYVREDTLKFPRVAYCHAEPQNALANYDPIAGKLTVWMATQCAPGALQGLAHVLDIPPGRIRVITGFVGGGFGGRLTPIYTCAVCASALSQRTGRPVKVSFTREQEFTSIWSADYETTVTVKTGVKRDGTLVAREATAIYDNGVYRGSIDGPQPHAYIAGLCLPYKIPNLKLKGVTIYTNKQWIGPYRGYGHYPTVWAAELQMGLIAKDLGIDLLKMKLANFISAETVTPFGWPIGTCGVAECLQKAANAIEWKGPEESLPVGRGKGLSTGWFPSGGASGGSPANPLSAMVRVYADGTAQLIINGSDSGAGQYSTLCMMVAEELGIPLRDIKRLVGDTDLFPNEVGPASVTISSYGGPVRIAASKARQAILEVVAERLEAKVADLVTKNGRIYVQGNPEKGMSFTEAARIATAEKGPIVGRGDYYHALWDHRSPEEFSERYLRFGIQGNAPGFSFAAAGAEVEVDKETGRVRILRLAHAYDVGFAVNPLEVEGQLQGGAGMSIPHLLSEEILYDKGQILNCSYLNYKMPTAMDLPNITPIIVEEGDLRDGPYGAKELGMGAISCAASAVIDAINNALGITMKEFPATPERILKALQALQAKEQGVRG